MLLGGLGFVLALPAFLLTYTPLRRYWLVFGGVSPDEDLSFQQGVRYRFLNGLFWGLAYLEVWGLFLALKKTFGFSEAQRTFYDAYSYVVVAEKPLASAAFWMADRPFSLPLLYKVLGVTTANYNDSGAMYRVATAQRWLSIFAWSALAVTVALSLRQRWIRLLGFAIILLFSLALEVSLWDFLLLSESLSFSFFALVLAGWLALLKMGGHQFRGASLLGDTLMVINVCFMGLYSFTRDSNLYFLLIAAVVFALYLVLRWRTLHLRWPFVGLILGILVLLGIQNYTLIHGNRWQIHIYDNLKVRIMPDSQVRAFFVNAGLPLTPRFLEIQALSQRQYQVAMFTEPALQPVREWIEEKGRATYLVYLLSRPLPTLLEPLRHAYQLFNGNNTEYRRPIGPLSRRLELVDALMYPRWMGILGAFLLLGLGGAIGYWRGQDINPIWVLILILMASLYPLMLLVWHGNPLEIERHAAQIGIQVRLMGWLALVAGGDGWLARIPFFYLGFAPRR
ncbi:MAG: hypothetical protein N3A60_02715 [Thermanaerothrix sp.]|nr:hypothetical protein [Thermanaerothrix sp.]